jgi:hypothetical protein
MTEETIVDTASSQETQAPTEQRQAIVEPAQSEVKTETEIKQFAIPDAYKDKAWATKVKSEDDLWKQLENTQSLIGKKAVVPDFKTATPAEIEDYYKQLRPQDKSAYAFDEETPPELKEAYGDLLYNNGISEHQGNEIIKQFREMEKAQLDKLYSADGFTVELEKSFGKNYKEQAGAAANLMKQHLNKEDAALLDKMPNQFLAMLYRYTDNIKKSYGASEGDKAASKSSGTIDKETRISEIFAELSKVKSSDLDGKNRLVEELRKLQGVKL